MNSKSVNFVSLDMIANKMLKHPLMKSLNYEDIIDHTISVLRLIKCDGFFKEEPKVLELYHHRAGIPKKALNLKTVSYIQGSGAIPMVKSSNVMANIPGMMRSSPQNTTLQNVYEPFSQEILNTPGVAGSSKIINEREYKVSSDSMKYSLNGNVIVCGPSEGRIVITYDTIMTDEDGIPMIPNSEALIKAISNYIKVQVFEVLVDLGRLQVSTLNRAETEYSWYIGQAQTEMQGIGSVGEMEAFINNHTKLFNVGSLHGSNYEESSDSEQINIL